MSTEVLCEHDATRKALSDEDRRRVLMTASCGDCRSLPKVPLAGRTFSGPEGHYQLMHNGVRVIEDCYYGRWMTELIRLLEGHHEPQEERAFHELLDHLPAGSTMVELGSYWAYYSLWFQRRVPDASLYLVEPDPPNLEVGRRNFALNGARGTFINSSVGRRSGPPRPFRSEHGTHHVPRISVDDLLSGQRVQHVDLLLSDIQGAEVEMLLGAQRSVSEGRIRFLVLSTHHHSISGDPLTHQKCLRLLESWGAHVLAAHSVPESYSGDGLVVASFDPRDRALPPIPISYNRPSNGLFPELEYDLAAAWQVRGWSAVAARRVRRAVGAWIPWRWPSFGRR